jgi:hypothetical protein
MHAALHTPDTTLSLRNVRGKCEAKSVGKPAQTWKYNRN